MIKLALIGYGQMGRMIESMAADHGFEVVSRIDPQLGTSICREDIKGAEIAIEFTQPGSAYANICRCMELGVKVVSGTTGWQEQLEAVKELAGQLNGSVVYGSNFSIGMNLFYEIVRQAAQIMKDYADYDVYGYELHHRYKKDSPSGTARNLAAILLEELPAKNKVIFESLQRVKAEDELQFASVRGGEIPGEHRIGFDSVYDSIELRHTARNRKGLAAGALLAASWLMQREGVFEFGEVIRSGEEV
ncbi:MAG: 4-hydroxy-tetrahydrodipicolinate reductase [Candidatus Cloacimonetes bacterium]|nr:4-hydroxy-tetrahydrodipicolinate reductase [Candidatus Cloacimonadota bacterium]